MPRGILTFDIDGKLYDADWDSPNAPSKKDLDEIEAGIRSHYGLKPKIAPMPKPLISGGYEAYSPMGDPNAGIQRVPLSRKVQKLSNGQTQIVEAYPDPKKRPPVDPDTIPDNWWETMKAEAGIKEETPVQTAKRKLDAIAGRMADTVSKDKQKIRLSPYAKQAAVLKRLGVSSEAVSQAIDLGLSDIRRSDGKYIPKKTVMDELARAGAAPVLGSGDPDASAERFAGTAGGTKPMPQTPEANTVMGQGKAFTSGRRKASAGLEKSFAAAGAVLSPHFEASMKQAVDEGRATPEQKRMVMSQIANASIPLGGGLGSVMLGKAFPAFNAANMAVGNLYGGMAAATLADPNAAPEEKYGALFQFAMMAGIPAIVHASGRIVTAHEMAPAIKQTMREFGVTRSEAKNLIGAIRTGEPGTVARVLESLMPDAQLKIGARIRDWVADPHGVSVRERTVIEPGGIVKRPLIDYNGELVPMGDPSWREAITGKSDAYEGPMQIVRKDRSTEASEPSASPSELSPDAPQIPLDDRGVKDNTTSFNPLMNDVDTREILLKLDSRDPRLDPYDDAFDQHMHDAVLKAFGEPGDKSAYQALERAQEEASYRNETLDHGSQAQDAWDTYGDELYHAMAKGRTSKARVFRHDPRQPLGRRWIPMGWAKTVIASDLPSHVRAALDQFADRWNNDAGYMGGKYADNYIRVQKMGGDYGGPKPLRASEWQLQDQGGKAQQYLVSMVRDFLEDAGSPANPKQLKRILKEEAEAQGLTEQELNDAIEYWTRRPESEIADRSGAAGENQTDGGRGTHAESQHGAEHLREGAPETRERNVGGQSEEAGQAARTVEWDGQKVVLSDPDLIAEHDAINRSYEKQRRYLEIRRDNVADPAEQRLINVQLENLKRFYDEDIEDFFLGVRRQDRINAGIEPDLDAEFRATIGMGEAPSPEAVAQAKRLLSASKKSAQEQGASSAIPPEAVLNRTFKGWMTTSTPDGLMLEHGRSGLKLGIVGLPEIEPGAGANLREGQFVAGAAWLTNGTDYMPVNAMIALAEGGRPTTVYHEAFHVMEKLGLFSEKEWSGLLRDYGQSGANPDPVENVADAYETWLRERTPDSGAFSKIKKFFGDLLQAAVNHQQWKKEQTFRKMESGKVWNRAKTEPSSGIRLPKTGERSRLSVQDGGDPMAEISRRELANRIARFDGKTSRKPGEFRKLALGEVSPANAAKVREATGIDISGMKRVIDSYGLRHIKTSHGDASFEHLRGRQGEITASDIALIPDIVDNPDSISATKTKQGLDAIEYTKQFDNRIYYLEEIRYAKGELAPKAMRKFLPAKDAPDVSSGPPPSTSETLRTDALQSANDPIIGQNTLENNGGNRPLSIQEAQTESPEFKKWFEGSKAVDEAGRPLVVYHGTVVDGTTFDAPAGKLPAGAFTSFDKARLGSVTKSSDSKSGFWFSADPKRAVEAASEAMRISKDDAKSPYVYETYLALKNPAVVSDIGNYTPSEVASMAKRAKAKGYDGLIFKKGEGRGSDYLVFEPEQIKSATANSGGFDPSNPDIRYSVQGTLDLFADKKPRIGSPADIAYLRRTAEENGLRPSEIDRLIDVYTKSLRDDPIPTKAQLKENEGYALLSKEFDEQNARDAAAWKAVRESKYKWSKSYSAQDAPTDALRDRLNAYAVLGEHFRNQGLTGRAWKEALVKVGGSEVKPYLDALWQQSESRMRNAAPAARADGSHLATGAKPIKPGRGILRTIEHLFFSTGEAAEHATKMLESALGGEKLEGSDKDLGNAINVQTRLGWKVETRVTEGIRDKAGNLMTKGLPEIKKILVDAGIDAESWQRFRRAMRELMIASRSRKIGEPGRVLANSTYIDNFVDSLSPEQMRAFAKANQEFDKYADAMLGLYEEYGMKPEGWAAQTRERNPVYFPMDSTSSDIGMAMQQLNPQKLASPGAKVMRAIGGSEYADGFASMAAKVEAITRAGELNKAMLPFYEEASANPLMEWCVKDITKEIAKMEEQRRAGNEPTQADLTEHAQMVGDPRRQPQPWVPETRSRLREAMRERRSLAGQAGDPTVDRRIAELDRDIRDMQTQLAAIEDAQAEDPVNAIIDRLDQKVMEGIDPIITLWKNGEKRVYLTDPWVWDAIRGTQPQAYNLAAEIMRGFAAISRAGTTSRNPFFGLLFNPMIDLTSAMIQHGLNPIGFAKGFKASLAGTGNELFLRAVRDNVLTGSKGSRDFIDQTWIFDPSRRSAIQKIGDKLAGNAGVRIFDVDKAWLDKLFAPMGKAIEAAEQGTRLAMYDQEYKTLIREGMSDEDAGRRAAKKAADLMNFGEAGQVGRLASTVGVPFANVPSQVIKSGIRGFKANPKAFLMRAALMITLPKLIEWAIYKDDPEYKAIPDYAKEGTIMCKLPISDDSWYAKTFGSRWIAIRIPAELGAIFAGIPMRILDASTGREKPRDAAIKQTEHLLNTFRPPVTPTAAAAVGQLYWYQNTGAVTDARFFSLRSFPTASGKGGDRYKLTVQEVDTLLGSLGRLGIQSAGYFMGKEKHFPNPLQRFAPTPLKLKPRGSGIKLPKPPSEPKIKLPNL